MPEYPDIEVYRACLAERIEGRVLEHVQVPSPSLLKTFEPRLSETFGKQVTSLRRLGKRVVIGLEDDLFLVIHLMIAGRFQWKKPGVKLTRRVHASFEFENGWLILTEAGTKKRASLHVVRGEESLRALDPSGLEIFEIDFETFERALVRENHTLKRSLTDPHLFSGIGNAYSDEILHRARLSPVKLTQRMKTEEIERLFEACRVVLQEWFERLRAEVGDGFPEKVTAFHEEMAVHGRYRQPCPVCEAPVQRIVRGDHETNYCPGCQNEGRVLADRALSQLLKKDWPRSLEELETRGLAAPKSTSAPRKKTRARKKAGRRAPPKRS